MPAPARAILCLSFVLLSCSVATAENWPGWRGPRGDGTSLETIPTTWNGKSGQNIQWKVKSPGNGHASPIVFEDRVYLVGCDIKTKERALASYDRRTGKELWRTTVFKAPLETKHGLNSYASSTPVTDGRSIFVCFLKVDGRTIPAPNVGSKRPVTPGRVIVAAYTAKGEKKWETDIGEFISAHGFCSCPVLYEDTVIVNGDHDGKSYIAALNQSDGKTIWKTPRRYGIRSYVTPIIRKVAGKTQMVLSGSQSVTSFDPKTGTRFWTVEGPTEQYVASMVFDGERFFMAAGYPTHHVMAIRPDGDGDVTKSHVAWHHTDQVRCYVPSPVLCAGKLFVADDRGTANCFDAKTGDRVWRDRLGRHFSASLVTAGGLVYMLADDGEMFVVKPGDGLNIVAKNQLGEFCYASPAISKGQLFIRSESHLFCIGEKPVTSE